jgi:hypothetical protein
VGEEDFWASYSKMEEAAKVPFDQFVGSDTYVEAAINSVRSCLSIVEREARRVASELGLSQNGGLLELAWRLAKAHVISPKLLEDLEDVHRIFQEQADRTTVYSALIRGMEVVEALWSSIKSWRKNG